MDLNLKPETGLVIALLDAANLPTDDITPALLQNFIGAQTGQKLMGVIGFEAYSELGLLRSLVVAPEARGLGLGTTLVAALEQLAADTGVTTLYLLTTDADHYFEKHGYVSVDRESVPQDIRTTRQFSSLCPGTAAVMVKTL